MLKNVRIHTKRVVTILLIVMLIGAWPIFAMGDALLPEDDMVESPMFSLEEVELVSNVFSIATEYSCVKYVNDAEVVPASWPFSTNRTLNLLWPIGNQATIQVANVRVMSSGYISGHDGRTVNILWHNVTVEQVYSGISNFRIISTSVTNNNTSAPAVRISATFNAGTASVSNAFWSIPLVQAGALSYDTLIPSYYVYTFYSTYHCIES